VFGKLFSAASGVTEIDVQEAKRRQDAGAVLVDVREPNEWRDGHAKGARHIPLGELSRRAGELPKDGEILLICRSGNRSRTAAQLLQRGGYERVVNVQGGTTAWIRQSLPLG
jgi:rhodanese-related sulfurtransferase